MKLYHREKYLKQIRGFYHDEDIIKVVTGLRRCGKSSLLLTIKEELLAQGVKEENILYLDLDKRGYRSISTPDQLEALIDSYPKKEGTTYLFIDEIQNVKGFETLINGYRTDGGYSIFLTGSNSYLLSGELMTKLTGRYIEFEMYTLSFDEYIAMKNFYHLPILDNIQDEFRDFILFGGFPKTLFSKDVEDKRKYVSSVVTEILQKDVYKRGKVRNRDTFSLVENFLIGNFGSTFSLNSLTSALAKSGTNVSKATVKRYLELLTKAKILYECPRFDLKSKKSLQGEKKYYLGDLSFYFSLRTDNRINYGPVLENIFYLYAKSMNYSISVGKIGNFECDFILRDAKADYSYVQICYSVLGDSSTEEREYRPLESVRDNYPKYVLTMDVLLQKRNGIHHENIVTFMKEGKFV